MFCHFDFQKCFAPQRRTLFRILNSQKRSCTGVFGILTSKSASRHNGVQFFISHLPKWLRTLASLLFDPHKTLEKHSVCGFSTFLCALILFLPFSSLICFLLPFSSLTLPSSAFPCVHIAGSLTSKLPFNTKMNNNHNNDANVNNMKVDTANADNTNIANSPVVILMRFIW